MYTFPNGGVMIETPSELPALAGASEVFLDFETSSGDAKLDSLNPWHHCKVAGFAITVDEHETAYYIPFQHWSESDKDIAQQWLGEILYGCDSWINHNVKYDAHVAANDLGLLPPCNLVCTVTLAKIIDSDRLAKGGYGLDVLSRDWLGDEIGAYEERLKPYLKDNKDYGKIPPDILGEYACQDAITNRRIWRYECAMRHEDCCDVWLEEIELTRNLFDMERNGLCVDKKELLVTKLRTYNEMALIDEELTRIAGRSFQPHVNADCYDVICNQFGMPIMAFTKDKSGEFTTNASFDKQALKMYKAHPQSPPGLIAYIERYRKLSTLDSLFLSPWLELIEYTAQELLHSSYNQTVRTGRMSCSDPNAQQLSELAKQLIHPPTGYTFISIDYSQIELRFIVHYIKDQKAITAFINNPDTDFHEWVGEVCGIKRKPAKSINFGVAFGEGKKKLTKQLSMDEDLIGNLKEQIKQMGLPPEREVAEFGRLAEQKAISVYNTYHATFPTIKSTSRDVERVCKQRGYLRNIAGRHRHLPARFAYRGFNTLNQGSAADMLKERTNAVCRMIAGTPLQLVASIHDALLFQAPTEIARDPRTTRDLVALMENPKHKIRVPIRCAIGYSEIDFKSADADARPLQNADGSPCCYTLDDCSYLEHCR